MFVFIYNVVLDILLNIFMVLVYKDDVIKYL